MLGSGGARLLTWVCAYRALAHSERQRESAATTTEKYRSSTLEISVAVRNLIRV